MIQVDKAWEEKKAQRLKNYIEYYDSDYGKKSDGMKEPMSLERLNELSVMELLDLMPQNRIIDGEYSDILQCNPTKAIVGFQIHKVIDGTWNLEYTEGHNDKKLKDQYVLVEFRCKDLRVGLIDMYLRMQTYNQEWWNGVRSGRIKLSLGDSWDDRENLGLPPLPLTEPTDKQIERMNEQ